MRKLSVLILLLVGAGASLLSVAGPARPALASDSRRQTAAPIRAASTKTVSQGDDLQAALDSAQPGDFLALDSAATFIGNFVLPAIAAGSDWITVGVSSNALVAPGIRVAPADAQWMPKILSPNGQAAIRTSPGTHHVRFIG